MSPSYFQDKYISNQEEDILREINDINRQLQKGKQKNFKKSNNNSSNQCNLKNDVKIEQDFQHDCDELFPHEVRPSPENYYTFENQNDSLFGNSEQQMLIDNELNKQIKYFKQFQTGKNSIKSNHSSKGMPNTNYKQKKSNKIRQKNQTQSKNSNIIQPKFQKSSLQKYGDKIKNQANNKKLSNYKNLVNKQNQLPFNHNKRERFQTMPDCLIVHQEIDEDSNTLFQQVYQELDSLQGVTNKNMQKHTNISSSKQGFSKQKNYRRNYNHQKNNCDVNSSSGSNSLQCTFKPAILKKSADIARQLKPSFQRLTESSFRQLKNSKQNIKNPYRAQNQQEQTKKYSINRMEQLSQPRKSKMKTLAEEQQELPSFRPSLSKKSIQQMSNCTLDVASRNKLWLQQKQAKITKMKQEQQQLKLKKEESSYMPKTNNYKGQQQVHLSRFTKEGIASYFQRISIAKQRNQISSNSNNEKKQLSNINKVNSNSLHQNEAKGKKRSYNQAVQELHHKILQMKI